MKRFTAAALTGVMLVGLLSGCGGSAGSGAGSGNAGGTQGGGNAGSTGNAGNSGEVYNVVMQWPSLGDTPAGLENVEAAINEITEPAIGCTVTLEPVNAFSIASETSLAVSSGEQVDICLALFNGVGDYVNSGTIQELDSYIDQYGTAIKDACGRRLTGGYYGGKLYGVPNAYIVGEKFGYVCRTDILEKYNIQIDPDKIYTKEELGEIFATVKAGEGDSFYCIGGTNSTTELFQCMAPYDVLGATAAGGVLMLGDDFSSTTVENLYTSEAYADYAQTMYEWNQAGYFIPDASTSTDEGATQVRAGNVFGWFPGMCSGGAQDYNTQTGMDMTVITTVEGYSASNFYQTILWCIPTTSANPEKAMQFLNYIYENQEVCNLLQFGIEGTDYVVVEENENGTLIDYPEGLDNTTIPYYQMFGVYGNRLGWPIRVPNTVDYNKNLKEFDASIKNFSPALGYCFVVDDVSTAYSSVSAVVSQYVALISTGAVDPAVELPEFTNALEAAGINDVIAENQRQLDEWLAGQN